MGASLPCPVSYFRLYTELNVQGAWQESHTSSKATTEEIDSESEKRVASTTSGDPGPSGLQLELSRGLLCRDGSHAIAYAR